MVSVKVPVIHCSIPAKVHPHSSSLEKESDSLFMDALGITSAEERKQFEAVRMSMFALMVLPVDSDPRRMLLASQHALLFFVIDDVFEVAAAHSKNPDEAKALLMEVAEGASSTVESENPLWHLFISVMSEVRKQMYPPIFKRYLRLFSDYADGLKEEVFYTKANLLMDPDKYLSVRRKTVYMEAATCLFCEFVSDLRLRQEVVDLPVFVDFVRAVVDHSILVNDLFSFRKEYKHGCSHNWLFVLLKSCTDLSNLQQVIEHVCEMIQEEDAKISKLQQQLLEIAKATNDDDLAKAAANLPFIASGNLAWSYLTPRYNGADAGPPRILTWQIQARHQAPGSHAEDHFFTGYDQGLLSMQQPVQNK